MQAYGYLRVSGESQIDGSGLERQKSTILNYAARHNIEIVSFYQDGGISGTTNTDERPAFQDMINDILGNGIRTVIIESLDRLARKFRIQDDFLTFLMAKNIALITADIGENVTEDLHDEPIRTAAIQMQGVFSELEKNLLVRKLRKSRDHIRSQTGKCEGRKGWNDMPEKKAELTKIIKRLRRKPKGNLKKRSYKQVAKELNTSGHTTYTGKKWTGIAIQNFLQYHS